MSSTNTISAAAVKYVDPSWYTGDIDDPIGHVYVYSRRISLFFAVHHFIVMEGLDDKWRVYEWMDYGKDFYACNKIRGNKCRSLGKHTLSDVYRAVKDATDGYRYTTSYNCNHWTERVAANLGYNITLYWDCNCISSVFPFCTLFTVGGV